MNPIKVEVVLNWEWPKTVMKCIVSLGWQVTIEDLLKDFLSCLYHKLV